MGLAGSSGVYFAYLFEYGLATVGCAGALIRATQIEDLFEHAYAFAEHNDAQHVTVEPVEGGFAIADDGQPVHGEDPEAFFTYGEAVPDAEAGLTLPNVRMLARTQGFDAAVDPDYDDGVRVVVVSATSVDSGGV